MIDENNLKPIKKDLSQIPEETLKKRPENLKLNDCVKLFKSL